MADRKRHRDDDDTYAPDDTAEEQQNDYDDSSSGGVNVVSGASDSAGADDAQRDDTDQTPSDELPLKKARTEESHPSDAASSSSSSMGAPSSSLSSSMESSELRILITREQVGPIIGHKGSNIARIRDHGVRATILNNDDPTSPVERVLAFRGPTDRFPAALKILLEILTENQNTHAAEAVKTEQTGAAAADAGNGGSGDADAAAAGDDAAAPPTAPAPAADVPTERRLLTLILLVHQGSKAAIIGRGGEIVQETHRLTGCSIRVSDEPIPYSTDHKVTVRGSEIANIITCVCRIHAQVLANPPRNPVSQPFGGPWSTGRHHPAAAAGGMSGVAGAPRAPYGAPYGAPPPSHHNPYGAPPQQYPGYPPPPSSGYPGYPPAPAPPAAYPGYGAPYGAPPQGGYPHPQHAPQGPYGAPPPPPGWGGDPRYGAAAAPPPQSHYGAVPHHGAPPPAHHAPRPPRDRLSEPGVVVQRIAIPAVCSGVVIGPQGSIVRDLVRQSGAKISLSPPDPANAAERVVTITGLPEQIASAIELIRVQVESYTPGSKPGRH